ncbi:hypothetical protein [Pseudoalteromonas denitrificans]|jgi:hypothetical protein|uniref:Uncharacterized protein n=1 Tax=Pseudoalteromonas denitrificans DSM 6059 TaxID=1123010 RepID=A0A1I1M5H2_9GAMM|nr:hypothetical protein [Pseudoalteromonas denitrificans]SFC78428.1 hypothetical protein SAMN02745724_02532 [Pseudoalteromonas denitrificans DSM 6059]
MALDFNIALVSPEYKEAIFSRGSLELTHTLIKLVEPELAHQINILLSNQPVERLNYQPENIHLDSFYVSLNSRQVRRIVEVLSLTINSKPKESTLGTIVLAKSLFEEWMKLAAAMMHELNRHE